MVTQRMPPARNVGEAIEASESLASLLAGHRRAQACVARLRPALPPALRALIRPGPIEGATLHLFVEHNAAAAKMRQLLPYLLETLRVAEPELTEVKLKIVPRGQPGGPGT